MNILKLIFIAASLFVCAGCKVIHVDSEGAIPAEDVYVLQGKLGLYQGNVESDNGGHSPPLAMDLKLVKNAPILTAREDILGPDCHSRFGKLLNLEVDDYLQTMATFEFDPGTCAKKSSRSIAVFHIFPHKVLLIVNVHARSSGYSSSEYSAELKLAQPLTVKE